MKVKVKRFSLLDNAHNFIEESLISYNYAFDDYKYWPFAILHLIQGLELLMKEVLRREHSILIYENIDNPKTTVSLEKALERLINIVSVDIDQKEKSMILKSIKYRNKIIHYEFDLNNLQAKATYTQLFEFLHYFHYKHLGVELNTCIDPSLHEIESMVMLEFKKIMVIHSGREVHKSIPSKILQSQKYDRFEFEGKEYKRIPFGNETKDFFSLDLDRCTDCGVEKGQYHIEFCDTEQCPICMEQLFSCGCDFKALEKIDEEE